MEDIFAFRQSGVGAAAKVIGEFVATGTAPTFLDEMRAQGVSVDRALFGPARARG